MMASRQHQVYLGTDKLARNRRDRAARAETLLTQGISRSELFELEAVDEGGAEEKQQGRIVNPEEEQHPDDE